MDHPDLEAHYDTRSMVQDGLPQKSANEVGVANAQNL
jgi:hypothetical protein